MFKPAAPRLLRYSIPAIRAVRPRRTLFSSAPPSQRSRSWKNVAVRLGITAGGVYYYTTSNAFAEEPAVAFPPPSPSDETPIQTLESIVEQRQAQRKQDEASQQGAFNEETGEINWDCPCLGGMAHGPCGEDFRAAFSCFVFSKSEPKGMDCIDNFKSMQECFRRHPDHYGGEFDDSDGQEEEAENSAANNPLVDEVSTSPVLESASPKNPEVDEPSVPLYQSKTPSSAVSSPQVDEPSVSVATSVSEGSQTTSDISRKDPDATKGQDRGLRILEPYQKEEGGERPVPITNHDSVPPS